MAPPLDTIQEESEEGEAHRRYSNSIIMSSSRKLTSAPSARSMFQVFRPTHPLVQALNKELESPPTFFPGSSCQKRLEDILHHIQASQLDRDDLVASGCLPAVLNAVKLYKTMESLVAVACDVLIEFAKPPPMTDALLEQGGLEFILDILQNDAPATVCVRACTFLKYLAQHSSTRLLQQSNSLLETILQVMDQHWQDANVQSAACGLLLPLSLVEACHAQLLELGGIPALLLALQTHPDHVGVQTHACGIFLNWTAASGSCQTQLLKQHGLLALLTAMRRHRKIAALQAYACGVLVHIFNTTTYREWQAQAQGVVTVLVTALRTHTKYMSVQESACAALVHVLPHAEFHPAGGVPAILYILQHYSEEASLVGCACLVLALAAQDDTHVQEDIRNGGGVDLLMAAMGRHLDSDTIQDQGLKTLKLVNALRVSLNSNPERPVPNHT